MLHQESGNRRNGLWKFPLRSRKDCEDLEEIYAATYAITRYRVCLKVFISVANHSLILMPGDSWVEPDRFNQLPLAAPFRKALDAICSDF
ncbi:MAG: hypothetical protein ACK5GK_03360 [Akkermansiaceae bacterium]